MASPNVETSTVTTATTGGNVNGVKVGYSATEKLGFFGATGAVQQAASGVTDVASIKAVLVAYGLIA